MDELALGDRALQAILLLAIVAAVAILVGLFPDAVRIGCLVVIAFAAVITSPARNADGGGWWNLLAAGAALSIAGAALSLVAETIGGLLAAIGGVLVVVGAVIGFPLREYEDEPSS